ncbi:hypothetical protein ABE096_11160 [Robertmurraya massiliosenegalensis]|uniref:hypothetical protein n=1 Tax=Robertmurraya massiliosenegalensis TaxID=1287657 RepID=UPI003D2786D5
MKISDIDGFSEDVQKTVYFMVSKGFLTLNGDVFYPTESMDRNNFTTALVKIFFYLDRILTTTFTDV